MKLPLYHDQSKYADWGWIRDQEHNIVANVSVPIGTDDAKCRAEKINPCKECVDSIVRACNSRDELLSLVNACFEWIDAVPQETQLPAMPGIDRDWAYRVIAKATGKESA